MNGFNNAQVNGINNVPNNVYSLLHPGENINDPNIPWLERFTTFCQRVRIEPQWPCERNNAVAGNGTAWMARLSFNGHMLNDVTGQGQNQKEAKARLVKRLEELQHNLLHLPLLPQYGPLANGNAPANGNALVNGVPVQTNGV